MITVQSNENQIIIITTQVGLRRSRWCGCISMGEEQSISYISNDKKIIEKQITTIIKKKTLEDILRATCQ